MINPNSYYTVQGWMLSELGLKGNALAVYAIIYGFSQDGASEYSGSARYLSEWLGCSTRTVLTVLADLTARGLLKKTTTYKNGQTFNNYAVAKMAKEAAQQPSENISYPMKNFHGGGEKTSPGAVKNFHGGGEKTSSHNTSHNDIDINRDKESPPAAPAAPAPTAEDEKKPAKHKYGEYRNVLLTDEEYGKLQQLFPYDLQDRIERLSEYIASKGAKYKSHYATIRSWANRDGKQSAPAGRARRQAGPVGPSGIALDPSKNDLAEIF